MCKSRRLRLADSVCQLIQSIPIAARPRGIYVRYIQHFTFVGYISQPLVSAGYADGLQAVSGDELAENR